MTLWPLRMELVREEDSNLYFNANSSWRWCDFSAHPRVMQYTDRTGVDLSDIRVSQQLAVIWTPASWPLIGQCLYCNRDTWKCFPNIMQP